MISACLLDCHLNWGVFNMSIIVCIDFPFSFMWIANLLDLELLKLLSIEEESA